MTDTAIRSDWAEFTQAHPTPGTVDMPISDIRTLSAQELSRCVELYLESFPSGPYKDRTEIILRRFQEALGNRRMTYIHFREAYDGMMDHFRGSDRQMMAPKTRCIYRDIMNRFEHWLTKQGYVDHRFVLTMPVIKAEPKFRQVVTIDEWRALRGHAKNPMTIYLLDCLWMTGFALVDIQLLEWKHVDLVQMVVRKHRQKTRTACVVPIVHGSPFHMQLIALEREKNRTVGVYPSVNGRHYVHNQAAAFKIAGKHELHRYLDTICKALGMRKINWHDFRSTFCTNAIAVGDPISVSQMTGHTDPKVLRDYSQPSLEKLRELMETAHRHAEGKRCSA
jgi:integrase